MVSISAGQHWHWQQKPKSLDFHDIIIARSLIRASGQHIGNRSESAGACLSNIFHRIGFLIAPSMRERRGKERESSSWLASASHSSLLCRPGKFKVTWKWIYNCLRPQPSWKCGNWYTLNFQHFLWHCHYPKQIALLCLASQDTLEVMSITYLLSHSLLSFSTHLTDVTLVSDVGWKWIKVDKMDSGERKWVKVDEID